jgi:hypothetical protein
MKSRVTVVGVERKENLYPVAGGAPRKVVSHKCKVILHLPDGGIDVGTLTVPDVLAPEGVTPGEYTVEFRAGRGFSEDKIVGVMFSFEGIASAGKPSVAAKQEAVKA